MNLLLNSQELELLSALNRHLAHYMVVGGHAVIFHGYLRPAKDLDLWIEPSIENAERVARALSAVRVYLAPEHIARLSKPNLQMPIAGLYTELLTSVKGLEFPLAIARSSTANEQGVPCTVIGLEDLLECKRLLGRESDLEDIRCLQEHQSNVG